VYVYKHIEEVTNIGSGMKLQY